MTWVVVFYRGMHVFVFVSHDMVSSVSVSRVMGSDSSGGRVCVSRVGWVTMFCHGMDVFFAVLSGTVPFASCLHATVSICGCVSCLCLGHYCFGVMLFRCFVSTVSVGSLCRRYRRVDGGLGRRVCGSILVHLL